MPTLTSGQEMLAQGFALQLEMYGHILSSGTNSFPCLMTPAIPVDPELLEMFKDPREVTIATVLKSSFPAWLVAQTTLTDESGNRWVAVNLVDNPSFISNEVWLTRVADVDT